MQNRWLLRTRLRRAFTGVAVLLLVFGAIAVFAAVRFARSGNDVIYRWTPAQRASDQALTDLVNQETGIRGYALTRQSSFLEPYQLYRKKESAAFGQARHLIGHDPRLRAELARFELAARDWQATVAEPLVAAHASTATVAGVITASARTRFDLIRARARTLDTMLTRKVTIARAARSDDGVWATVFAALAVAMVAASGFVLRRGLDRWILGPIERLGAQTRALANGATRRELVADGPVELTELGRDVEAMRLMISTQLTEAERIQEELRQRSEELARSNDDLQQFAYVASHDMSEPLRKVSNFCQLLERQYGPQLDDRARQYIDFAVDGAKRMQALINDLLELSRVGRNTEAFTQIDLEAKLDLALSNLGSRVPPDARIERVTPLPTVWADRALMISLLENLVGNALKYRRSDVAPVVRVSAELDESARMWTVTVSDNGIGVDAEYAEKIFAVFQRLHLRDQYGGTGIGLALCRKIVQFHGGQIWLADVESGHGRADGHDGDPPGATFRFTLPEGERIARNPN